MKILFILLVFFVVSAFSEIATDDKCDQHFHTGKKKTLVKFYDSNNQGDPFEKQQNEIWQQLKEHFSDFNDMELVETDCSRCPQYCSNFINETFPSYTMVYGDLLMSACVRPLNYEKVMNYVYDYMPKRYKKKKNFTIAITHCDIIYPELRGTEIFQNNFNEATKSGLSFVLFFTKWCHYCKQFYPLWAKLIDAFEGKNVNFYRVDCITYKDFCVTQKAIGFPTLNIYADGQYIEEYYGDENILELEHFVNLHLKKYAEKQNSQ